MRFRETKIPGAFVLEIEEEFDERGFFARSWCKKEFEARGLRSQIVQCNIGFSPHRGTVRGIHYQKAPHAEAKVVRCCRGGIYDVIVDVRPSSQTYGEWSAIELTADNHTMIYIPEGVGHGYQTLCDPAFAIEWPLAVTRISQRDARLPNYKLLEKHLQTDAQR